MWKTATTAMQDVAAQANQIAQMEEDCMAGRDTACDNLSKEEAKRAWLKKLDHVEWNNAAQAVAQVASFPDSLSEQDAKAAWLAKLDAPTWGAAAAALTSAVSEAASIRKLEADCAAKVDVACDSLSGRTRPSAPGSPRWTCPRPAAAAATVTEVAAKVQVPASISTTGLFDQWLAARKPGI